MDVFHSEYFNLVLPLQHIIIHFLSGFVLRYKVVILLLIRLRLLRLQMTRRVKVTYSRLAQRGRPIPVY